MKALAPSAKNRVGEFSGDLEIVSLAGRNSSRGLLWNCICRRVRADGSQCNGKRVITVTAIGSTVCCAPCAKVGGKFGWGHRKYKWSDEHDRMLRKISAERRGNGCNSRGLPTFTQYAQRLGLPKHAVLQRARNLGLVTNIKEPAWTERELKLLERWAWMTPMMIHRRFVRAGLKRSMAAIMIKRKRLRLRARREWCNARELGESLGVDSHKVADWVKAKLIKAQVKTSSEREGVIEEYIFMPRDIKRFIFAHSELIDLRKVDQPWFWDMIKTPASQL